MDYWFLLLLYLPKIILTLTLFSEDVFRLLEVSNFQKVKKQPKKIGEKMALALTAVPFTSLLYGMIKENTILN